MPTLVTGFHDALNVYTETGLNIGAVNGAIYTAPPPPGTPATQAIAPGAGRCPDGLQRDVPRVAAGRSQSRRRPTRQPHARSRRLPVPLGAFLITGGDLTLDAAGDSNAVWVFQMASSLTVGNTITPSSVLLLNGAQAKNVFWQVGSSAAVNGIGGGTMASAPSSHRPASPSPLPASPP